MYLDAVQGKGQLIRHQLGHYRLVPLAVRMGAHVNRHGARWIHANECCLKPRNHGHVALSEFLCRVRGLLGVTRQTYTQPPPLRPRLRLEGAHSLVVADLADLVQRLDEAAAVIDEVRRRRVWELVWVHQIAPPYLNLVETDSAPDLVDAPLDREAGRWPRDASISAVRAFVCGDAVRLALVVLDPVGA